MRFVIGALAVWRLTSLIVSEDGPGEVFVKIRSIRALDGVTSCSWCASVWAAFAIVICQRIGLGWLVEALALSAAAIGVEDARNHIQHSR